MSIFRTLTSIFPIGNLLDAKSGTEYVQDEPGTSGHMREQENCQRPPESLQKVSTCRDSHCQASPSMRISRRGWSMTYFNP